MPARVECPAMNAGSLPAGRRRQGRLPSLEALMRRWLFFAYGVFCHLLFLATFALLAAFVGNFLTPKSIDSPSTSPLTDVGLNLLWLGLFAAQHSIMARPWFKKLWTRLIPEPIERSTYVLLSCVALLLLMWQ